eukprot:TRINITY_DN4305_c0_g1_i1.p2 TRINITY_DN4305_c0_g1~~TRINITY_DN4305_c0_g1_i1.p2  ORF type:complete len:112 (-),score=16.45 TRINITY_DN4305_c0_g1_i1:64-399(-)
MFLSAFACKSLLIRRSYLLPFSLSVLISFMDLSCSQDFSLLRFSCSMLICVVDISFSQPFLFSFCCCFFICLSLALLAVRAHLLHGSQSQPGLQPLALLALERRLVFTCRI